ncbi:MAG: hypothetical protein V1866_05170 [archaeon]
MEEETLLKVALALSIIGICALLIVLKTTEIAESGIGQAKELEEGSSVKITGIVERISAKDQFTIITLRREESISVVAFDNINISKGQRIEVIGKIKKYEGANEIVADNVIVLAK